MSGMKQLLIICLLNLAGQFIAKLLPIPFSGSVIGMILALVLLLTKVIKPEHIKDASEFLLANMAMLFVPAGANIIKYYDYIKSSLIPIVVICIASTIVAFLAAAYAVIFTSKLIEKHNLKKAGKDR